VGICPTLLNMQLIEIKDKKQLDDFVDAQLHAEFLQSWQWGEFQEKVEGRIMRLGLEEDGKLIAAATIVKKSLPLGMNYFYCPRGPVIREEMSGKREEIFNYLFSEIKKITEKESVIFLRLEPDQVKIPNTKYQILKSIDIQVSKTIILDLNKSEDELLSAMHQKTRYNIRLAEKKGVKIREAGISAPLLPEEGSGAVGAFDFVPPPFQGGVRGGSDEFYKFWDLMSATVNRDGFRLHSKEYYQKMLDLDKDFIKLCFGEFDGKILCAGIFCFFGDTAVYLHGASSNENREVMAPYLLQWEMIRKAKALGLKYYDFSGIDEKKWPGVTRFKRGFTGQETNYPGTFDVIFNKTKYGLYQFLRKLRRLIK
jgi:peptidoglycan pentaglycine glycine transferase (the first glycine)